MATWPVTGEESLVTISMEAGNSVVVVENKSNPPKEKVAMLRFIKKTSMNRVCSVGHSITQKTPLVGA